MYLCINNPKLKWHSEGKVLLQGKSAITLCIHVFQMFASENIFMSQSEYSLSKNILLVNVYID